MASGTVATLNAVPPPPHSLPLPCAGTSSAASQQGSHPESWHLPYDHPGASAKALESFPAPPHSPGPLSQYLPTFGSLSTVNTGSLPGEKCPVWGLQPPTSIQGPLSSPSWIFSPSSQAAAVPTPSWSLSHTRTCRAPVGQVPSSSGAFLVRFFLRAGGWSFSRHLHVLLLCQAPARDLP